jgi:cysteine desulfurase
VTQTLKQNHYLDYNASAPLRPSVVKAMNEAMSLVGNPSSVHKHGREIRKSLSVARNIISSAVGAAKYKVVFTSGGTESNNLALRGCNNPTTLVSDIEHDSILVAAKDAIRIPVNAGGIIDLVQLETILSQQPTPALISVMLANNETGVIQPLREVSSIAHKYNSIVHCDGVQAFGKLELDMGLLNVDLLSLSPHKVGGPKGIGALIISDDLNIDSQLVGGSQEFSLRAGTENFVSVVGFAATCAEVHNNNQEMERILNMHHQMENKLKHAAPDVQIHGSQSPRLINTTCVRMHGLAAETQVIAMDLAGVSVSAGSACSSGKVTTSHVLQAMGLSSKAANETIRISIGWATTAADIEHVTSTWIHLQETARSTDFLPESSAT